MAATLLTKSATALQMRRALLPLLARRASSSSTESPPPSSSAATPKHYDVIIGGGGLVGTTLAAAMAKNQTLADKRILLLEGAPPFKPFDVKAPYGNRVSAINHNSISLFKTIGAWPHIEGARIKHVKQMQVWDASSDALIQFQHEHFADDVACIIENDLILDAMYAQLKGAPNVEVRNLARIEGVRLPKDTGNSKAEVELKGGETYTCELLVGADGANSLVRKQMDVDVFAIDYKRMGVVATLQLSEDAGDNAVAWQRFIPTGPLAMLPLNETTSSLVWSTEVAHAKQLLAMPEADFVKALNEAFCKEYAKNDLVIKAVDALNSIMGRNNTHMRQYPPNVTGVLEKSRAGFPLGFLHASTYVCAGAALIGDAAHRIHPLAGQGVNLGFSDVRHLVECVADGCYAGAKLGDKHYLLKYEQQSLTKNVPILIGVHGLQQLYSTTFSPVVLLRSLGLQFTQNVPQLKGIFMKRAMG